MSRYDISYKWETEKWIVVDLLNRNCPTGDEFYGRVEANRRASELNRKARAK